jgi:hypothetical protein
MEAGRGDVMRSPVETVSAEDIQSEMVVVLKPC